MTFESAAMVHAILRCRHSHGVIAPARGNHPLCRQQTGRAVAVDQGGVERETRAAPRKELGAGDGGEE